MSVLMSVLVLLINPRGGNKQALYMEAPCLTQGPIRICINWWLLENLQEGISFRIIEKVLSLESKDLDLSISFVTLSYEILDELT